MKIDEIGVWESFLSVARHSSFSKAANEMRLGVPQLSKRIARLESELGVRLFQRTTRVVSLTDEAKALLPKLSSIIEDLAGLESLFEDNQKIAGTVRITCVPFVANRLLIPAMSDFNKLHPDVNFEINLSETVMNLVESNFDMAIRIQDPRESSFIYRKLAANELVLCASPSYLKRHSKRITEPRDLMNHSLLSLDIHSKCRFVSGKYRLEDFSQSRKFVSDNGWFLTELALQGFGVLVRSAWDVRDHLRSGTLLQVMKRHPLENFGNIYAVIPSRRYLAPRVRAFFDFIVNESARWSKD
jgi:DNA-binding transcriptional LysR family regulator